jgi:hypothetical protein
MNTQYNQIILMSNDQSILGSALENPKPLMAAASVAGRLIGYICSADETLRSQLYGRVMLAANGAAAQSDVTTDSGD